MRCVKYSNATEVNIFDCAYCVARANQVNRSSIYATAKEFDKAIQTAGIINNVCQKSIALNDIAQKLIENEQDDKACRLLSQALQAAGIIKSARDKAWALNWISGTYARAGQFGDALKIANSIEDLELKSWALANIAHNYSDKEEKDKSAEILSQALQVAYSIVDDVTQSDMLRLIVDKYATINQYKQAFLVVQTIKANSIQADALTKIIGQYAESQSKIIHPEVSAEVIKIINTINNPNYKDNALYKVSSKYVEIGQITQALELIQGINDVNIKALALLEIANRHIRNKDKDAEVMIAHALGVAGATDNAGLEKAEVLANIATAYAKIGDFDSAVKIANSISEIHEEFGSHEITIFKYQALFNIAIAYTDTGQFEQALQFAEVINSPYYKVEVLSKLVYLYAKSGQFEQALKIAYSIEDEQPKAWAIEKISLMKAEKGQVEQALQLANTITFNETKSYVLECISRKYVECGQYTQALEILKTIDSNYSKAAVLAEIDIMMNRNRQKIDNKMSRLLQEIISDCDSKK